MINYTAWLGIFILIHWGFINFSFQGKKSYMTSPFQHSIHFVANFFFFLLFGRTGVWTKGFETTKQMPYHLNHTASPQVSNFYGTLHSSNHQSKVAISELWFCKYFYLIKSLQFCETFFVIMEIGGEQFDRFGLHVRIPPPVIPELPTQETWGILQCLRQLQSHQLVT
jgi:hypothetical protein